MTALEELIKKWKNEMENYIPNTPIYKVFIEEAESYLEKEKQQIATAFDIADNINTGSYINGTDYYEQTYKK